MPTGSAPTPAQLTPALLVSACLVGVKCNHRGAASPSDAVQALGQSFRLVPVCPETLGGLPTPRPAAELQPDGRVVTAAAQDVSAAYRRGADATIALARAVGAESAVLKARSPSCGCHEVYDGTFTGRRRAGMGITAAALVDAGIAVRSEEDVETDG